MLKSRVTIALIIMIWGITYIGGVDNNIEEKTNNEANITINV